MSVPIHTDYTEVLDYFGRCANCDYPASAAVVSRRFPDGTVDQEVIATCGLPCGWHASVPMTKMTNCRDARNAP